jgi:HK97 family phage major capsid protein
MDEKTLKDLRDQRTKALEEADAIIQLTETENRGLTAEENEKVQAYLKEADRLKTELEGADRARQARATLEEAKRASVPDVATAAAAETTPERRAQIPQIQVAENEARAYRKGDGLAAIIGARIKHDAHQQHVAVRDAERLYGSGSPQVRALQQSSFTAGGALIPENFVGSEFIEALRAESAFRRAGPRMVQLVNGSFTTPRLTGTTTVGYLPAEGDNLGTSEPTFGQLKLVEKKVGVIVPFSNDLRRNASLDAIRVVTEDLVRTVATDEDTQCFNGTALAGTPKGIYNWIAATQKANQTGTALANFRTDVRKMKNGLDSANVPYVRRAFFMHSRSMNYVGWDLVDGNGNFAFPSLQSASGASLGGDPVFRDNVLSITGGGGGNESQIFYVEMSECYLAESMDMEIQIFENAAYSQSGTIRSGISRDESVIRLIRKWDFGMRHTESAFIIEAVTLGA